MAATVGRIGADRREVGLRVEVDGPGNVPRLVVLPRPHVDEHDAHRAPRGAMSSSRISWSGKRSPEVGGARSAVRGPGDHGRPRSRQRRAAAAGGRRGADRGERLGRAVRLVEPVAERGREERRIAARRAGAEQRRPARARGRLVVGHGRGQRLAGALGRGSLPGDDGDRGERQPLGDPRDPPVPREREPAEERRGEVVGVRLERDPDGEQLLGARVRRRRDEAERDRGRRRAEPALERDPVREAEVLSGRVGEQRIRAHGEVGFVGGKLARALALDGHAGAVGQLELVPEIEGDRSGVEAGTDVGRRRWGAEDGHPRAAAAIASGSASTCSSAGA